MTEAVVVAIIVQVATLAGVVITAVSGRRTSDRVERVARHVHNGHTTLLRDDFDGLVRDVREMRAEMRGLRTDVAGLRADDASQRAALAAAVSERDRRLAALEHARRRRSR